MDAVRVDQPHLCKLSFPKRTMDRVVTMTVWKLFRKWWVEHRQVRIGWACVVFILLGIIFFRATRGTGISIYIFLLAALGLGFYESPIFELVALPALLPLGILAEKARRRARGHYLPAIASVEAGGVKRGLTAPEAAIILELPLARVLTLIIFGLLKKGILKQIEAEPLEVQVAPEYASLAPKDRAKKAQAAGTVLHAYEQPFLDEIEAHPGHPLNRLSFAAALKAAIESTAKRMKGFDLERSRGYYRYIVSRAWAEARAIGDIEQRTEYTDDNLLWLLAADNGYDSFDYWWRSGYHYHAPWSRGTPMGGGLPTPGTPVGGTTSFRDVAQSFSGWAENVTGGLAGHLDPISVGVKDRGILDLSGADKVTVDMLETLAKSSGGGGGGGGCACAGCACACACAGGGR